MSLLKKVENMSDKCILEDIMYKIDFVAQVLEGLEDAEAGRSVPTEELLEKIEQWGILHFAQK
ncbi:MAG: hypothetical protein GY749_05785 [Desulfobacteraceae bacterium]|nr:hypothetical protein [Desulfobacteraceae bacterium]